MFLRHLTRPQGELFVALAKQLVASDQVAGETEARALQSIEAELGISATGIVAAAPTAELLSTFSSEASRAAVLLELLGLAYVDGAHHPREAALIKSVADGWGVSEVRLLQMENWVLRQMSLAVEANGLLVGEN